MKVTVLMDNLAEGCLRSEHGLSLLVQTEGGSVLFDTGQTDAWFENLLACRFAPSDIKAVALSHGHYDHTGGLAAAATNAPEAKLFAHPSCFEPKYSKSTGVMRYIGMPPESAVLQPKFTLNRSAVELLPGITLSGEIALHRAMSDHAGRFLTGENGLRPDTFEDEQCVVVRDGNNISVLLGCAHRGVENNVLTAMEVAGVDKIGLLLGGMHLQQTGEERLSALADFLKRMKIGRVVCCHCTGLEAYKYLHAKIGPSVALGRAGMSWEV